MYKLKSLKFSARKSDKCRYFIRGSILKTKYQLENEMTFFKTNYQGNWLLD